jgi:hypothetical protein
MAKSLLENRNNEKKEIDLSLKKIKTNELYNFLQASKK